MPRNLYIALTGMPLRYPDECGCEFMELVIEPPWTQEQIEEALEAEIAHQIRKRGTLDLQQVHVVFGDRIDPTVAIFRQNQAHLDRSIEQRRQRDLEELARLKAKYEGEEK